MKKLLLLFALQPVLFFTYAVSLNNEKIKVDTNTTNDYLIVPMPDNGYFMASRSSSAPTVSRLDSEGNVVWAKTFDHQRAKNLLDACVLADTGIALIYYEYDSCPCNISNYTTYLALKLGTDGTAQWSTLFNFQISPPCINAGVIKPLPDGGLIFVPRLLAEIAAIKLNPDGSEALSYAITADTALTSVSMGLDAEPTGDGGMIIVGEYGNRPVIRRISANGTAVWTLYFMTTWYYFVPYSIIKTSDGNYLVAGNSFSQGFGGGSAYKGWLMKIDPSGNILWGNRYTAVIDTNTNTGLHGIYQLAENPDGSITAYGYGVYKNLFRNVYEMTHVAIITFNAAGGTQSASSFRISGDEVGKRIYSTTGGGIKLSSAEMDSVNGNSSGMLVDPFQISDYCRAQSFSITTAAMSSVTHLPTTNLLSQLTLDPPTHPVITTRDTTISITTSALCGIVSGINEITAVDISLSPNPASSLDIITLKWQANESAVSQILVRDISGRIVKQVSAVEAGSVSFSIDGLLPGLYFAEVLSTRHEKLGVKKLLVAE